MTMASALKRKRSTGPGAQQKRAVKARNARRREQAKHVEEADTTQQGNRANVRQNTTRQGHRRSA
jgi:hypothetical protein